MSPTPVPARTWSDTHSVLVFMLKTAAGAVLLAGLVWYVDIHALIASVQTARPGFLAAGAGLAVINIGLQFARWKFLLRLTRVRADNASVFASLAAGFTAGFFTPGQIGEIGGRLFGNLPLVKEYFSLVIGAIIVLSVLPIAYEVWRQRRNARRASRSRCLHDADGHDA